MYVYVYMCDMDECDEGLAMGNSAVCCGKKNREHGEAKGSREGSWGEGDG
jgi:hypothetical protein